VKLRSVRANNRKRVFEVRTALGTLPFPYSRARPQPTRDDPVVEVQVDPELAVEARRLAQAGLSRREVCRRLGTSASQLYRLVDTRNGRTSMHQLVTLLHVLGCDVSLKVKERRRRD
jgi:predicted XRE-type DNA-binding protein